MSAWLWSSALLMGLAGGPHCLAMCGAACTALGARCGGARPHAAHLGWQAGRLVGYALAGAAVASSVSLLAQWGNELAWLRPWWMMLHLAAFALGVWMAWHGRAPRWLAGALSPDRLAAAPAVSSAASAAATAAPTWQLSLAGAARTNTGAGADLGRALPTGNAPAGAAAGQGGPPKVLWMRAAGAGAAWVALPCGLLQSALVVAALGSSAWEGALVMACFALGSGLSLWVGPTLWSGLSQRFGRAEGWLRLGPSQALRLAGLLLAIGSAWSIGHHVLAPWISAYCA